MYSLCFSLPDVCAVLQCSVAFVSHIPPQATVAAVYLFCQGILLVVRRMFVKQYNFLK